MIQRTTATSRDVGDPFELISAKPPPMTRAAKAITKHANDSFRAPLHMKRDCEKSGGGRWSFPSSNVIEHGPEALAVEQVGHRFAAYCNCFGDPMRPRGSR